MLIEELHISRVFPSLFSFFEFFRPLSRPGGGVRVRVRPKTIQYDRSLTQQGNTWSMRKWRDWWTTVKRKKNGKISTLCLPSEDIYASYTHIASPPERRPPWVSQHTNSQIPSETRKLQILSKFVKTSSFYLSLTRKMTRDQFWIRHFGENLNRQ